ncbi:hypothetical protein ACFFWC_22470 [Plantactinospora siamensis]|uniref:HTH luxR-type domain-containing protein n=1 Tax=Plantactinospora siamensis TaxID=555372 RepID=A0ABV6NYN7_9ACTN
MTGPDPAPVRWIVASLAEGAAALTALERAGYRPVRGFGAGGPAEPAVLWYGPVPDSQTAELVVRVAARGGSVLAVLDPAGPLGRALAVALRRWGPVRVGPPDPAGSAADRFGAAGGVGNRFGPADPASNRFGPADAASNRFGPVAGASNRFGPGTGPPGRSAPAAGAEDPRGVLERLVPEQRALLNRLANGETIAAAAAAEFLSLRTANRRIAQVRHLLGVRTTRDAVRIYLRQRPPRTG